MRLILIPALLAMSGCSWMFGDTFDNKSLDYLEAQEAAATQVPEGMTLNTYDRFPVPELAIEGSVGDEFRIPAPSPLLQEERADQVTSLNNFRSGELNPRFSKDGSGTLVLRLDASFALAWARVADAITASDLNLSDLNRSLGVYFLTLANPAVENDDRSWWARLWGDDIPASIDYQLKMVTAGEGVYLTLLKDAETLASESLTRDVLEQVKQPLEQ